MQLDKDGIITLLIGLVLLIGAWAVEFYLFNTGSAWNAVVAVLKDLIIGGIAGVGLLLIIVGILFMTAW